MSAEKNDYLKRLLETPIEELREDQQPAVKQIKLQGDRVALFQLRLLQMIDETHRIQKEITQSKGGMGVLGDMLWDQHNESLEKYKDKSIKKGNGGNTDEENV